MLRALKRAQHFSRFPPQGPGGGHGGPMGDPWAPMGTHGDLWGPMLRHKVVENNCFVKNENDLKKRN